MSQPAAHREKPLYRCTVCHAPNGPLLFQQPVVMVTEVSRHHCLAAPAFVFIWNQFGVCRLISTLQVHWGELIVWRLNLTEITNSVSRLMSRNCIFSFCFHIYVSCRQITTTSTQSVTARALDGGWPFPWIQASVQTSRLPPEEQTAVGTSCMHVSAC